jgi:hypothetical protein
VYDPADATFDFPICRGAVDSIRKGMLKCAVWDDDRWRDDYLGEVELRVEDWFSNQKFAFDEAEVRRF